MLAPNISSRRDNHESDHLAQSRLRDLTQDARDPAGTPGIDVTVIEYLKTPYERARLAQLIRDAGLTVKQAIRDRGTDAVERGLPDMNDDAILDAMVANPAYVNRPFVETDRGVRFCRPQEIVREIL